MGTWTGAHAQDRATRDALNAFRDSLSQDTVQGTLLDLARHADSGVRGGSPRAGLRLATTETRLGALGDSRDVLDRALMDYQSVIRAEPSWPEPWYGLAVAKLVLYDKDFAAKEGPWQRPGEDYLHGAAHALVHAIELDSTFARAGELLVNTVLRQTGQVMGADALKAFRILAAGPAGRSPGVLLGYGVLLREQGDADSALATFRRYFAAGGDSGLGLLEEARTLFRLQRAREAAQAYYAGAALASSPVAHVNYRSDLAWIATPEELAAFDSTTGATREAWLRRFWARRDALDGRAPGDRLVEHYRRLDYAMREFQRIANQRNRSLRTGNDPGAGLRAVTGQRILRIDGTETDESIRDRELARTAAELFDRASGESPASISSAAAYARLNAQTLLRAYRRGQALLDDRGIVYIRLGPPAERASYHGAGADPNESWKYYTPEDPLILHFVGLTAPTELVEQLPLFAPMYAARGGLAPRYDRIAMGLRQAHDVQVQQQELNEDREAGREAIAIGTTTDNYSLSFERRLGAVVQVFGVRQGLRGTTQVLVVFAIPAHEIRADGLAPDGRTAYPVHLRVIAERHGGGGITRLDTTRVFVTAHPLGPRDYLTGQSRLALPPGRYTVRAILGGEEWKSGAVLGRDSVPVPGLDGKALGMSDLIPGQPGSGQTWLAGPDTVPLDPLNAYSPNRPLSLYYQLGGLTVGTVYRTSVTVRAGRLAQGGSRVVLRFEQPAAGDRLAVLRSVSLEKLAPGPYVVVVRVEDPATGAAVQRLQQITLGPR